MRTVRLTLKSKNRVQTAAFIFAKMNGRFFDGNKVEAYFFEEERFSKGLFD